LVFEKRGGDRAAGILPAMNFWCFKCAVLLHCLYLDRPTLVEGHIIASVANFLLLTSQCPSSRSRPVNDWL